MIPRRRSDIRGMVEFVTLQGAKRIGPPNDSKRVVDRDRGERSHPDNMLREDVIRFSKT